MGDEIQYWWVRIYDGLESAHVEFHGGESSFSRPALKSPVGARPIRRRTSCSSASPRARA